MAPVPLPWSNQIFNASQGRDDAAIRLRVDVGIRANGGDTGEYPGLTSPALVVVLAIIGLLSLTMFSIFGRRVMDSARRRHRGQGMGQQTDSETREDHYLFLADMLGLDVGQIRERTPQLPLPCNKPKMWDIHAAPCRAQTRMERPLCWGDIMVSSVSIVSGVGLLAPDAVRDTNIHLIAYRCDGVPGREVLHKRCDAPCMLPRSSPYDSQAHALPPPADTNGQKSDSRRRRGRI